MAICTTASVVIDMFLTSENTLNYCKLKEIVKKLTYDLNKIIEKNNDILNKVLQYILLYSCFH